MSATGDSLATTAEIAKLGRLLEVDAGSLDFLEGVEAAEIRELRRLAEDSMVDADRGVLMRLAAASKLLPLALVAAISQRAFGPLLAARITGVMDPVRAADVGRHLHPSFLADVCVQLDPRPAKEIIPRMDIDTVVAVTEELLDRGDFVTMGRFVGAMTGETLAAVLEITEDDELLKVCALAESAAGVDEVFDALSVERLADLRRRARRKDLRQEALVLKDRL